MPDVGIYSGLQVILNTNTAEYYCSATEGQGFRILLNSPHEQHRMHCGQLIPKGYEVQMIIEPKQIQASPNIRQIPIEYRQCLFQDENPLNHYRCG